MSEDAGKNVRGRPPNGEKAMTAAERQQRVRFRRATNPSQEFIGVARVEIHAQNWGMARIEEAISAMNHSEQRDLLLRLLQRRDLRKRALDALKKADTRL